MGRTILLERRQSESVGRRNSRTTFLRSDWPRPFARREVGVEWNWQVASGMEITEFLSRNRDVPSSELIKNRAELDESDIRVN
ncbi:hypothetical protein TNCV_5140051 [Trichonephila clavipes]|nr:hypothetical protein TNCV_5140051 [Trichonephila clavipes]